MARRASLSWSGIAWQTELNQGSLASVPHRGAPIQYPLPGNRSIGKLQSKVPFAFRTARVAMNGPGNPGIAVRLERWQWILRLAHSSRIRTDVERRTDDRDGAGWYLFSDRAACASGTMGYRGRIL